MHDPIRLEKSGTFGLGCNYWASHAGTAMWSDWRADRVAADLQKLAGHGIGWLRVFTLWPDFQPITQLRTQAGRPVEMRFGEAPLPAGEVGQAGVSVAMLERFAELCALAETHGLWLIVGLVTGWMSGRLYTPPALDGLDPITDPTSITWQIRMVRTIVTHARGQRAVAAWDLGNECNCMGATCSREAAYLWTAAIANTIRSADPTRPIVSGMHSLGTPAGTGNGFTGWTIDDQGELTDLLTTHPYPYWTRHTRNDAVNTLRTTLHATAETRFYADIGGKPCFAEEIGTMGPMVAGDEASADFARVNLFSLWANDCRAFMWWCAHDQTELVHAPYDWNGVETELGLLRNDGSAKPVLREMSAFRAFLDGLPFETLPRRRSDGVCLLTRDQDDWAAAFGAFVLGKQAKLDLEFRHIMQSIPDAELYLLPSLMGSSPVPRRQWLDLLERVKSGATLYVSLGDGIVPHFNEIAGVELINRAISPRALEAVLNGAGNLSLPMYGADDLRFVARGAEVLGSRADTGQPIFWRHIHGRGQVIVYAAPLETGVTLQPGAFDDGAPPFRRIYETIRETRSVPRSLTVESPAVAATEHLLADGRTVVILINHTAVEQRLASRLKANLSLAEVWRGEVSDGGRGQLSIHIPAFDAVVFALSAAG